MATAPGTLRPTRFDPRWLPLAVTTVGSFMSILDSTIVNIALPSVLKDFHAGLGNGQLVLTSYLMALAVVIPVSGFLGERIGMKRLYIITLVLFTAGSALCGLAWNLQSLIAFRVLQGLGGGMLQPLGMAIVFSIITPLERPYFMGMLGIPVLLGPILGPTVGGYLVEYSNWRMIFLINVPIGLANVGFAYLLLKETARRTDSRLDVRGFVLAAIAFPSLLLGLSLGAEDGWHSVTVLTLLGVGLVALLAFIRVELKHHDPMLRIRLFSDSMFSLAMGIQAVSFFSLFGLSFLLPIFLQTVHGWGAAQTGLVLLPMGIVAFISMNVSGRLYNRVGPRPLTIAGLFVLVLTTALFSRVNEHTAILPIAVLVGGRGLALGMFSQTVQMVAYNAVPEGQMPRATALVNVAMRINGSLAAAVLTTVLALSLSWHGAPIGSSVTTGTVPMPIMLTAFREAFLVMTGVSCVGVVLAWFLHDPALRRLRDARMAPEEVSEPVPAA